MAERRVLRSDDTVRRVRAMWLGSGSVRWPVDWTFVEWGIALGCALVVMPLVGLAAGVVLGALGGVIWAVGLGGWLTYRLFERLRLGVDSDRPVRWWLRMIRHELRSGRPDDPAPRSSTRTATWLVPVSDARRAELTAAIERDRDRSPLLAPDVRWRRRRTRRELANGLRVGLRSDEAER